MYPDSDERGLEFGRSADPVVWASELADKEMKKRAAKTLRGLEMPRRLCRSMASRVAERFEASQQLF
jgi:hypothetical protein